MSGYWHFSATCPHCSAHNHIVTNTAAAWPDVVCNKCGKSLMAAPITLASDLAPERAHTLIGVPGETQPHPTPGLVAGTAFESGPLGPKARNH